AEGVPGERADAIAGTHPERGEDVGEETDTTNELGVIGAMEAAVDTGNDLLAREELCGALGQEAHGERPVHHQSAHGSPPRKSRTWRVNGSGCSRCGWCATPSIVTRRARRSARRSALSSGCRRSGLSAPST